MTYENKILSSALSFEDEETPEIDPETETDNPEVEKPEEEDEGIEE